MNRFTETVLRAGWVAAFFAVAVAALFATAMGVKIDHDEHQFVAAGKVFASTSLLPYRDFPYFHTPVSVWTYAMLFALTDHLLLAARAFSSVCAWISLVVVFGLGWVAFKSQPPRMRPLLALSIAALLFTNPIFAFTSSKSWNHALPVLLSLLAFATHWRGASTAHARWFFLSGMLVSLAIGTRISFAPLALPFLIMAWFVPEVGVRVRLAGAALFCGGMAVGLLPSLAIIAQAPEQFLFDNFVYNGRINAAYRGDSAAPLPSVLGKGWFLLKTLVHPANLALFTVSVYLAIHLRPRRGRQHYPLLLVLALIPFAALGALVATPSYTQYYNAVVALCAVGVLVCLAQLQSEAVLFRRGLFAVSFALAIGLVSAVHDYRYLISVGAVDQWQPMKLHADGRAIRSIVSRGPVLTLAPMVPLEGGLEIYEAFANGPFAWRTGRFLSAAERKSNGFVLEDELAAFLTGRPPAAILVGYEKKLEGPLVDYAEQNGYRKVKLPEKKTLWVHPDLSHSELAPGSSDHSYANGDG